MPFVSPVDIAKIVGIDPGTARRYLRRRYPHLHQGIWQRFDAEQLSELVEWCRSQQIRHRRPKNISKPDTE